MHYRALVPSRHIQQGYLGIGGRRVLNQGDANARDSTFELLQEDGTLILQEDGTSALLLE